MGLTGRNGEPTPPGSLVLVAGEDRGRVTGSAGRSSRAAVTRPRAKEGEAPYQRGPQAREGARLTTGPALSAQRRGRRAGGKFGPRAVFV
jgi:hypothetical protein